MLVRESSILVCDFSGITYMHLDLGKNPPHLQEGTALRIWTMDRLNLYGLSTKHLNILTENYFFANILVFDIM